MEELIIQRNLDYVPSNTETVDITSVRREWNQKDRIILSVIITLLLSFALLFAGYCIRKVHAFLYPQYNLEWLCQVPQIPSSMPVYEVTPYSAKDCLEKGLQFAEKVGAKYNHIFCNDKRGIFIDSDSDHGVHLLLQNNKNRGYCYYSPQKIWTGWKRGERTELEKKLALYSITLPENAEFRVDRNGWHTFTVAPSWRERTMVAGQVRCRCTSDGAIAVLENTLMEYTISGYYPVQNAKSVRKALVSGKYFRNMGFDSTKSLYVVSAYITYIQESDNSCVPYCCFQMHQGNTSETKDIMIPLLANGSRRVTK